jgi:hypothetical protein
MMDEILSVSGVTTILVLLLTLVFQYFPGLRVKWGGLATNIKMGIVLALYIVVGAFVAFGGCAAFLVTLIPGLLCSDATTFTQFVFAVLIAVGSGQGVFELLPEKNDVTEAKADRPYSEGGAL